MSSQYEDLIKELKKDLASITRQKKSKKPVVVGSVGLAALLAVLIAWLMHQVPSAPVINEDPPTFS
jgi:site-specific recombinase